MPKYDVTMVAIALFGAGWLIFVIGALKSYQAAAVLAFWFIALLLIRAVAVLRSNHSDN